MEIKEKTSVLAKKIEKIILTAYYNRLKNVAEQIQVDIRQVNLNLWKASDTYDSLLNGDLTHELGFPKGEAGKMVDAVLEKVADSIIVLPRMPRKSASGNKRVMSFKIVTRSLPGVLSLPESEIITGKSASNDVSGDFGSYGSESVRKTLPWVEWLLFKGNSYIIFNYEYVDVVDPDSRSGKGLMVRDDGQNWKVPSAYSGTRESNWITRELEENITYLRTKYIEIINKYLSNI